MGGVAVALVLVGCSSGGGSGATASTVAVADSTSSIAPATTVTTTDTTDASTVSSSTALAAIDESAASLAAELSAVEEGIRRPDSSPTELSLLGRRQQLAYRAVNQHPDWQSELTGSVDPVAQVPLAFHLAARQAQIDHAAGKPPGEPVTTLPAWTIVDPLPIEELLGYYREAEAATGVPWQYLAAIHFQETRMGRIVGVSSAGAVGPMQFLPSTWAACCVGDPTVARDAILGAAMYLVMEGAPGDMQAALNGYNPNSAYVGAVTAYAQNMLADERAYFGYHGWDVFYGTSSGTIRLSVGYSQAGAIDVASYLAGHPADLVQP
jgi:hypothetical protein